MQSIIETVSDAIFAKRELLKTLNEEKEEILSQLCSKQQVINQNQAKIESLERELKALYNSASINQAQCYDNGPMNKTNRVVTDAAINQRRD